MEPNAHYAVRRGWNAARSEEFTVVSPAYTVTLGVLLKRMVPTVGPQSPMPHAPSSPTPLAHPPAPGAVPPRHRSTHRPPWPAAEEAAFAAGTHSSTCSTAGRNEIATMCGTGQTAHEPMPRARAHTVLAGHTAHITLLPVTPPRLGGKAKTHLPAQGPENPPAGMRSTARQHLCRITDETSGRARGEQRTRPDQENSTSLAPSCDS